MSVLVGGWVIVCLFCPFGWSIEFFPHLNLIFNLLSSSNYLKCCSLDVIFPVWPNAPNIPMFHSQTSHNAFIHVQFGPQTWGTATSPPRSQQDCSLCRTFQYIYKIGILEAIDKTMAVFGLGICLPSLSSIPMLSVWVIPPFSILSPHPSSSYMVSHWVWHEEPYYPSNISEWWLNNKNFLCVDRLLV